MSSKILVAGNFKYGIASEIFKRWPEAHFASRSNGFDLNTEKGQDDFARLSVDFDTVIFCSTLRRFNQTLLVENTWRYWVDQAKKGRFVCLGSTADRGARPSNWMYPIEKKGLRSLCQNLNLCDLSGSGIRVSYLSIGFVKTPYTEEKHPGKNKLSTAYVVDLIEWILAQPEDLNVHSISVDPRQPPAENINQ
ncbi:MAG: hypothetical protein H6624_17550 [Bdellovibrionaceae bacterium]|nr:hypothetical protein [Bdellovibrionales bacterium]MCB9086150.1 hypothetical protein [Pseudobdellovibrionaceae bacterium]